MDRIRRQLQLNRIADQYIAGKYREQHRDSKPTITVAVLDTGVVLHPDLRNRVIAFRDFVGGADVPYDDNGHGTHISGIIASEGRFASGKYRGINPNASICMGKVLAGNGDGDYETMLRGMRWIRNVREKFNIKILNISVGMERTIKQEKIRILNEEIAKLWEDGIVVVCAAGNKGPGENTISSLGIGTKAIVVGCHDGGYYGNHPKRCEIYSGEGSSTSPYYNPDIVAPGTQITSCNAAVSLRNGEYENVYCRKSGTSMAAAITSGIISLVLMYNPEWTNEDIKKRVRQSAEDLRLPFRKQGFGMINPQGLFDFH